MNIRHARHTASDPRPQICCNITYDVGVLIFAQFIYGSLNVNFTVH